MFNSDRYLRDSCLSIVKSITTQDLTKLTIELAGLTQIDHGRGSKSWGFKSPSHKRTLNAKIAKSFLEHKLIIPKR